MTDISKLTSDEIEEIMRSPDFFKMHFAYDNAHVLAGLKSEGLIGYDRPQDGKPYTKGETPIHSGASYEDITAGTKDLSTMLMTGYGSSEIRDTDGDNMLPSALESMTRTPPGLLTWMDHTFKQDNMFGSLQSSPKLVVGTKEGLPGTIKAPTNFGAVQIESDVEWDNPAAGRSAKYIAKGRRLGWSGGFIYTKYKKRQNNRGEVVGIDVHECVPIEWSVVGMPANQVCWVTPVVKSLKFKGVLPPDDDTQEIAYVLRNHQDLPAPIASKMFQLQRYLMDEYGDLGLCIARLAHEGSRPAEAMLS